MYIHAIYDLSASAEFIPSDVEVFLAIEKSTKPDCLICTNTSGLNIDDIAAVLKDPSRVMGTHFFSPANVAKWHIFSRYKVVYIQTYIHTCIYILINVMR